MGSFEVPTVQEFHDLYRHSNPEGDGPPRVYWLGIECIKCPLDLWVYQEIIHELKPKVILEGGTASGGTSLFLAHMLDLVGDPWSLVVTIDRDANPYRPPHRRIHYVTGDVLWKETKQMVEDAITGLRPRLVILDDSHSEDHVFSELEMYDSLLAAGDYLIVEDTNLGGPQWALERFVAARPGRFERDVWRERLLMTQNPRGYWKCVA